MIKPNISSAFLFYQIILNMDEPYPTNLKKLGDNKNQNI